MTGAASLLAQGQRLHHAHFPAFITINAQGYDASSSGMRTERDLETGGPTTRRERTFWLPIAAFDSAGQPPPIARQRLTCESIIFGISEVRTDATGTQLHLVCHTPPEG